MWINLTGQTENRPACTATKGSIILHLTSTIMQGKPLACDVTAGSPSHIHVGHKPQVKTQIIQIIEYQQYIEINILLE